MHFNWARVHVESSRKKGINMFFEIQPSVFPCYGWCFIPFLAAAAWIPNITLIIVYLFSSTCHWPPTAHQLPLGTVSTTLKNLIVRLYLPCRFSSFARINNGKTTCLSDAVCRSWNYIIIIVPPVPIVPRDSCVLQFLKKGYTPPLPKPSYLKKKKIHSQIGAPDVSISRRTQGIPVTTSAGAPLSIFFVLLLFCFASPYVLGRCVSRAKKAFTRHSECVHARVRVPPSKKGVARAPASSPWW